MSKVSTRNQRNSARNLEAMPTSKNIIHATDENLRANEKPKKMKFFKINQFASNAPFLYPLRRSNDLINIWFY